MTVQLYFGGWDNRVHAIDAEGKHKWGYKTADHIWSSPAIGNNDMVYCGAEDYYIFALKT